MVPTSVGNFFRKIVEESISIREERNILRKDLIHLLMLARNGKLKLEDNSESPEVGFAAVSDSYEASKNNVNLFLTNEDITAQALVFFLGGYDTSSRQMAFAAYELAVNPQIQSKLRREIRETWTNSGGRITYETLLAMRYLDMVMSESHRKWPQSIWIDRKCTEEFTIEPAQPGEIPVHLKKDDVCWMPVYAIHRDSKYYPDPERFDPERFNDDNKDKLQSGVYIPFGLGPRNCIGSRFALLEAKILFFYLLLEFEFVPTEKTQIPLRIDKNAIMLQGEKGFHVGMKRATVT